MGIFKKILAYLSGIVQKFPPSKILKRYLILFNRDANNAPYAETNRFSLAVEGVRDPLYFILVSALLNDLKSCLPLKQHVLFTPSVSLSVGNNLKTKLLRSFPFSWLVKCQWLRAYSETTGTANYDKWSLRTAITGLTDWLKVQKLWKDLQTSGDISGLYLNDILVGDLIIDTYLRYRPSYKFNISDPFVKKLLYQSMRDIEKANQFFLSKKINVYLTTFSTYIEHGIPCRVALRNRIPVFSYGNAHAFGKRLQNNDLFHLISGQGFRNKFEKSENKDILINGAKEQFDYRLSGGVDLATYYMAKSAYSNKNIDLPAAEGAMVIFMHDFFDSPHCYHEFIFQDFWEWVTFTIETLYDAGAKFLIKPHPNQILESDRVVELLNKKYPDAQFISEDISNIQLAEAGIKCGISVYGTIAHELAYMGVPTICCSRHPHHEYDFCLNAGTISEYEKLLRSPIVKTITKDEMKHQALEFYAVRNVYGPKHELEFRKNLSHFFTLFRDVEPKEEELVETIHMLKDNPVWKSHLDNLSKVIQNNAGK